MSNLEQTLSIIKPDAVERNLAEEIKNEFKNNGFIIKNEKKIKLNKSEAELFYEVHQSKPFYNALCEYLSSGTIVVMVLEKNDAVSDNRKLMGATNPKNADMQNINYVGGASSITAAQFLQRFILNDTPWAHLDIAGMAFSKYAGALNSGGATGYGVRLLNKFVEDNYE